jgi:RND superfamily putative drug exporter
LTVGLGILASSVAENLTAGGGYDPASESARAAAVMEAKFGRGQWQLLITVTAPDSVMVGSGRDVGTAIVDELTGSPHVASVVSPWTIPPGDSAGLISTDSTSGLIVANIKGSEDDAPVFAKELAEQVGYDRDGVTVRAGGLTMFASQIAEQTTRDLLVMESIAIPLSFLVLVWVFGGLVAAALPVAVGIMTIVGSMAVLRLVSLVTEVSTFALNLSVGLGLALAVDYTLLIVSRYRDELADGAVPEQALVVTLATAGRTVAFSATTVALSMAALILFPMSTLRSLAYAGIGAVGFAAVASVIVAPAVIVLLGDRINSLDVRLIIRRTLRRPPQSDRPIGEQTLYRTTKWVMRHAVPVGLGVVVLLLVFGAPFVGVKLGIPDDRMLPASASARQVGEQLRNDYDRDKSAAISIVIPDAAGLNLAESDRYAAELSRVADVLSVTAPGGTYVDGARTGPPSAAAAGVAQGSAYLTVESGAPPLSTEAQHQLDRLHEVAEPGGRPTLIGGSAQIDRDNVDAIVTPLPWVLAMMVVTTFVLLFGLTGSIVVPLKALVLSVLSLTATFGALVWFFQEGHLGALGTTAIGTLPAFVPLPLFCFAFALSMDYEVFLVSRIREYWLKSGRTRADNEESVALGLARAGRVVTAAALLMAIPFAAQIAAQVSIIKIFGVGLTLALLVDATLIRMVLLPVFMQLLGRWNWWAPRPLAQIHDRLSAASPRSL